MRIIAGELRGRTIYAPAGTETRPTQDKVREALFNILRGEVEGARVLDLFGGSGALALEAVSRGAHSAAICDASRAAIACIRRNVENARVEGRVQVLACDYRRAIDRLRASGACFDLVFLDPPYRMENTGEIVLALHRAGLLGDGSLTVIEQRAGLAQTFAPPFAVEDTRVYGITQILFVRKTQRQGGDANEDGAVSGQL